MNQVEIYYRFFETGFMDTVGLAHRVSNLFVKHIFRIKVVRHTCICLINKGNRTFECCTNIYVNKAEQIMKIAGK